MINNNNNNQARRPGRGGWCTPTETEESHFARICFNRCDGGVPLRQTMCRSPLRIQSSVLADNCFATGTNAFCTDEGFASSDNFVFGGAAEGEEFYFVRQHFCGVAEIE